MHERLLGDLRFSWQWRFKPKLCSVAPWRWR